MTKFFVFAAALMGFSCLARAHQYPWHHYHYYCAHSDSVTLVASKRGALGPCQRRELSLQRVSHNFPLMGSLTVNAWVGGYTRSGVTTNTYRVDQVDPCSGARAGSYTYSLDVDGSVDFNVDNPNLHSSVQQSFVANAPMTDQEAQAAMSVALRKCQNSK